MTWNPRTSKYFQIFLTVCLSLLIYFGVIFWEDIPIEFVQSHPRITLGLACVLVFCLSFAIGSWSKVGEARPSDEKNADSGSGRRRYSGLLFGILLLIICLTAVAFGGGQPVGPVDPVQFICAIAASILIVSFIAARRAGF